MISKQNYEMVKEKYGFVSSWTIWKKAGKTPKSNTEDMSWIYAPDLLSELNTGYVFVGLNASSTHGDQNGHWNIPWSGFHSGYSYQHDYKLRYALVETRYWGSYITDVIKHYPEVDSGKVKSYLRRHPEIVKKNIKEFEKEISYLGSKPILVALGGDVYRLLKEYLVNKYTIVQIKHFSYAIGKEDYRREVLEVLDKTQPGPIYKADCNFEKTLK